MRGMETDLEVIGLVQVLLALRSGSKTGRMSLRLEHTLRGAGPLRVQRRGAGRGRERIGGREIDVHDGSGGDHTRKRTCTRCEGKLKCQAGGLLMGNVLLGASL